MFFLSGKRTSCSYGPDARVLKNIQTKKPLYSESVQEQLNSKVIDTLTLHSIFKNANINFSKSDTKSVPCRTYYVEGEKYDLIVENCTTIARIKTLIVL